MMLIRQLGLKAYVDFPGAIHTRFSHALGTMQLARKLVTMLADELNKAGQPNKAANLEANLNNLMAAGLLHDIGHGPFSHVVDYPASKLLGKTHVEIGAEIIANEFGKLERHGVTISSVIDIIKGQHAHPFLHQIIDGPIDVDKLDYLLRDSHHVGLRYHFDLDQFLYDYLVLGNDDNLQSCVLGLTDTLHARTTAEIFVLIWKGMYDLVYHIEDSRIAEKMLEHAILAGCKTDTKLKAMFSEEKQYRKLYDDMVLDAVGKVRGFPKDAVGWIRADNLYRPAFNIDLSQKRYSYGRRVIESLLKFDETEVADTSIELSKAMCKELDLNAEQLIVDLVKSRKPKSIHIKGNKLQDQPKYLEDESDVIGAIDSKIYLKAYIHPALSPKISENDIEKHLKKELETWS
jgi:HD superfamily phosphohydrolase